MDSIISIDGVILTSLKVITHPLGDVFHGMKKDEPGYSGFGEAYFSTIKHGTIKPWKKHLRMTLNLIVPIGSIRFVVFDDRGDSNTNGNFFDVTLSPENYYRLTVPPSVWMGFQGIGKDTNLLLNVANIKHDPEEIIRTEINSIFFKW